MISIVVQKEVMDRICEEAEKLNIPVVQLIDRIFKSWIADREDGRLFDPEKELLRYERRQKNRRIASVDYD